MVERLRLPLAATASEQRLWRFNIATPSNPSTPCVAILPHLPSMFLQRLDSRSLPNPLQVSFRGGREICVGCKVKVERRKQQQKKRRDGLGAYGFIRERNVYLVFFRTGPLTARLIIFKDSRGKDMPFSCDSR
ncbi:hypothetical protein AKJ16_DCAP07074 [Drosera capensis]